MAEFPALPPASKRGTGCVYFLLAKDNLLRPMMKIGFSLRSPDSRLSGCQTGSPVALELVALITGDRHTERGLHKRFTALHSHREWFFYEGELKEYVEGLNS